MIHQVVNSKGNFNYNAYIYDGIQWSTHFHKNFELIYEIEGNNIIYVDGIKHHLQESDIIIIPPGAVHSFDVKPGTKVWVGVFSSDYISLFAKNNSNKLYSKFKCDAYVEAYLRQALFYQGEPDLYMLKSALYAVCNECKKNAVVLLEKSHIQTSNKILDYVSNNFHNDLTMKAVATNLGYEYHYFSNIFHKCFNMNFKELLNLCRFEKACELLEKTNSDLTSIALESGFQSVRNFNNIFKTLSGITPSEYKKIH